MMMDEWMAGQTNRQTDKLMDKWTAKGVCCLPGRGQFQKPAAVSTADGSFRV